MTTSGPLVIRPPRRDEVGRLWELLRGLAEYERLTGILTGTPEMLDHALFGDGPRLEARVAERDGALTGYALFYPVFGSFRTRWRYWLEDLYVAESERRSGLGRRLLAEVAAEARRRGFFSVDWDVLEWNVDAIGFYERLGAVRQGKDWHTMRLAGDALERLAAD